ncbi:MAG: 4,5-DOPA dioxygenase extradiol [Steroidobacteraceae bacterium]
MRPRQPALFIGHGSPMQAIEPSRYTAAWEQLGRTLPRPRAIVVVSAHWYTDGTAVTTAAQPATIHDFYGFPAALYELQYPARGDAALAARVQELLAPTQVRADTEWGLDHGSWSVLRYMYPAADIPTIQLSIDAKLAPRAHYQLGRHLNGLRDAGVLIIGSGNVVHNLRALQSSAAAPALAWASEFNDAVRAAVLAGDHETLIDYQAMGSAARLCVPTAEHYLPLLYVLGLQSGDDVVSIPIDGIDLGAISMLSVQLGA